MGSGQETGKGGGKRREMGIDIVMKCKDRRGGKRGKGGGKEKKRGKRERKKGGGKESTGEVVC